MPAMDYLMIESPQLTLMSVSSDEEPEYSESQ